jgi:adenylosuccinate lyase
LSYDSISPVDGRYSAEARPLAAFFSERALVQERVKVELGYLALLVKLGVAPKAAVPSMGADMSEIKRLEDKLGHDVKAVEVFLREWLLRSSSRKLAPFVHIGLTSEDTNSLAFASLLGRSLRKVMVPAYAALASDLATVARREAATAMTARTHGRPAVPTTFGKEMSVFAVRIAERVSMLRSQRPMAKFSGAVGTYASFDLLGQRDWQRELERFVSEFGADASRYSTQVVPGERLSDILHLVININQLMISLARDLWLYQTLDLVHFERPGKVSSSTMPQKVNPVDLENAEGQAEVSNSLLTFLAYRLQITRLQRDLSDSVIRRMLGQGLAHSLIAASRVRASISMMRVERRALLDDLKSHPEVYAEREQIVMRMKGDERGYEKVRSAIERDRFKASRGDSYLGHSVSLARACPSVVRSLLKSSS